MKINPKSQLTLKIPASIQSRGSRYTSRGISWRIDDGKRGKNEIIEANYAWKFHLTVCSKTAFLNRDWSKLLPWIFERLLSRIPEVLLACGGKFRFWPKADTSSAIGRSREKNLRHGAKLLIVPVDLWAFYANQIESLQLSWCGPAREEMSKDSPTLSSETQVGVQNSLL